MLRWLQLTVAVARKAAVSLVPGEHTQRSQALTLWQAAEAALLQDVSVVSEMIQQDIERVIMTPALRCKHHQNTNNLTDTHGSKETQTTGRLALNKIMQTESLHSTAQFHNSSGLMGYLQVQYMNCRCGPTFRS